MFIFFLVVSANKNYNNHPHTGPIDERVYKNKGKTIEHVTKPYCYYIICWFKVQDQKSNIIPAPTLPHSKNATYQNSTGSHYYVTTLVKQ